MKVIDDPIGAMNPESDKVGTIDRETLKEESIIDTIEADTKMTETGNGVIRIIIVDVEVLTAVTPTKITGPTKSITAVEDIETDPGRGHLQRLETIVITVDMEEGTSDEAHILSQKVSATVS